MSAASYLETCMVMARDSGTDGFRQVDRLLVDLSIVIVPVTREDAITAREGFLQYGKGRHKAGLNFGDCFSYALAKRLGESLLFKGDDFIWTDVLKA
jgi:ribonuclease VapC